MEKAAFGLTSYRFSKAYLDFNIPLHAELNITFAPKGVLHCKEGRYDLTFDVVIDCKETTAAAVKVSCEASFTFGGQIAVEDIPDYFYPNSIAILFPYIRAFVSTLSLQANIPPIILPTLNLAGLTPIIKEHTQIAE